MHQGNRRIRGVYLLLLYLPCFSCISVGRLGQIRFSKGYYVYVGSAQNSLLGRVSYHLKEKKKKHWHIDYLTEKASIVDMLLLKNKKECALAENIRGTPVKNFGSTDCSCLSHLFYFKQRPTIFKTLP